MPTYMSTPLLVAYASRRGSTCEVADAVAARLRELGHTVEVVNDVFAGRADHGELEGILGYSEEPLVSSDVIGSSYSSVFDAGLTSVVDGTQVKVVAWYDNEWGYSSRLVDLAQRVLVPVTV